MNLPMVPTSDDQLENTGRMKGSGWKNLGVLKSFSGTSARN